jgi:hypothetical protein
MHREAIAHKYQYKPLKEDESLKHRQSLKEYQDSLKHQERTEEEEQFNKRLLKMAERL